MDSEVPLKFRIASEPWEFEQINRLNYDTFIQEIPQHERNETGSLVDKFDLENTYIICRQGEKIVGMIAVRDKRPFSLDQKLSNLDSYLPPNRVTCEFRLLSVEKGYRNSRVLRGLVELTAKHCIGKGYDLAVISGLLKQEKLYKHLGFVPFGPEVGTPDATFQPMYLTLEVWRRSGAELFETPATQDSVNLLPGPVSIADDVRNTFRGTPVSHRSEIFLQTISLTKQKLCTLAGSQHVEILLGSGTLANDAIAGQLSLHTRPGLILSNGEFGNRLIDHAKRWGLTFGVLQTDWGEIFERGEITSILDQNDRIDWIWAVHCETSTGVMNDLDILKEVAAEKGLLLCLDAISSIGSVPVDLSGVYLASGVSGKGLGGYPGLALVFHDHEILPSPNALPRYLDLGLYALNDGVPFTHSSNLVNALHQALASYDSGDQFKKNAKLASWLRGELRDVGLSLVASEECASPAAITIALPEKLQSDEVGMKLEKLGYYLYYRGGYLRDRNWIQICLMGECSKECLGGLVETMARVI